MAERGELRVVRQVPSLDNLPEVLTVEEAEVVEAAIAANGLGEDQADVVRAVTLDGDTVACVVGPAGTGKSRAMRAAAQGWGLSGAPVRGLAVSAVAAGVLAAEADIPADTIAKFLYEHDRATPGDPRWRLRAGEVAIVDEAGMVASRDLARLALIAQAADAKLVLVGDHAQLGAVEAGGLFRLLADAHGVELSGVRRFTQERERRASLRLRARDPSVLDDYLEHGRLVGSDRLGVLDTAADRWHTARARGESLVVCATDHATVSAICDKVQAARIAAGEVDGPGAVAAGDHMVGVSDEVVTLRNDRRLMTTGDAWVRNGDRWRIAACHPDGSVAVSHLGGHGRTVLPADYVANDVALAYALTVHKAQGITVDNSVLVVDETTTAEALYVGMSRGRGDNTALVCCDSLDLESHEPPISVPDAVAAALGRAAAEESATAALRHVLDVAESLAVLAPRLASVTAQIQRETPDNPEPELTQLAARRAYIEQHARPGRLTRGGRDDRRTLRDLDARKAELEEALAHRDKWLAEHADLFAYRDQLAAQVADRRKALGVRATLDQPHHLVELLGEVPDDHDGRARWTAQATRIEAYRERWGIDPDQLRHPLVDGIRYREWDTAVHSIELANRFDALVAERALERSLDRGLSIEL